MTNNPPSGNTDVIESETFVETALRTKKCVVVGQGIAGHQLVHQLFSAGVRADRQIEIQWIADRHNRQVASFGASGWHMPFLNDDPRVALWAQRSFRQWSMLSDLRLGDYLAPTESVFLTREPDVKLPRGHPGTEVAADPADYSAPFYRRAARVNDGSVISTCALMPRLYKAVSRLPGVTPLLRHLRDMDDLLTATSDFGAEVACVAAGDRAQFLFDDNRIEGDFGVLLLVDSAKVPDRFRDIVLVDQDRDHELTYSVPHRQCGHICLGGTSGRLVTEPAEYAELARGLDDLRRAPQYVNDAILEIRDRVRERLPMFDAALAKGEFGYWYGLRPAAERLIAEWIPRSSTGDGIGVLHVGGLGGSGFTVIPALAADSLRMRRPTEDMEFYVGQPTPVHSS